MRQTMKPDPQQRSPEQRTNGSEKFSKPMVLTIQSRNSDYFRREGNHFDN